MSDPARDDVLERPRQDYSSIYAMRTSTGDLAVVYFERGGEIGFKPGKPIDDLQAWWYNPRDGSRTRAALSGPNTCRMPDSEDWALLLHK